MRILLDLQGAQATNRLRGIGRYSLSLAQAIARRAGNHEVSIALNSQFPETVSPLIDAFADLIPLDRVKVFHVPNLVAENLPMNLWRARAAEHIRRNFIENIQTDIVHISSLFEGFSDGAVTNIWPGIKPFSSAVTLYDLIPLVYGETHLTNPELRSWYFRKLQSLKNSDIALAISDYSKQEAIELLHLPENDVVNISAAVDAKFCPKYVSRDEETAIRLRLGLAKPFIMYVGGFADPRKNVEGIVAGFARLAPEIRDRYQLAIVCTVDDADRQRLERLARKEGVPQEALVLTGQVSDDDLISLYNLCKVFVFPSLHEGFGLPVLEAMACGAPVIGSSTTSIPEVIGRMDALFDPSKPEAIGIALHNSLTNDDFLRDLAAHGVERSRQFSWDESARRALAAFEESHTRNSYQTVPSVAGRLLRPRLAYVSPLPPIPSGIADYSAELIPEIARFYEIDLVVDQPSVDHPWLTSNYPIRTLAWFEANADQYDRIVYHFGNNYFHKHMFALLRRHPGVVVVHDFYLSGVTDWMDGTGFRPGSFPRVLYQSHGYFALKYLASEGREAATWAYPCNKEVLDAAAGVIVHSRYAVEAANKWYGSEAASDWKVVPHLRALPKVVGARSLARQKLGLPPDAFLVCSFGFINRLKLSDTLIRAWANSALASDERCYLVFVGENHQGKYGDDLKEAIARSPAPNRIKITGYASTELYRNYLAAADVAVQLRTLTRGETSGTVLDSLAHGIPLILNAHGSMAEYPDEVVFKLSDRFEDAELSTALESLFSNAELRERRSCAGRDYVRDYFHPKCVAEQYRDAIENFSQHSPTARYQRLLCDIGEIVVDAHPDSFDIAAVANSVAKNTNIIGLPQLLIDISELVSKDAKSGIQRVVRSILIQLLLGTTSQIYRVEPVYSDGNRYRYAREFMAKFLGVPAFGMGDDLVDVQKSDVFLGLDLHPTLVPSSLNELRQFKNSGVEIYFVIYDILPLLRPAYFHEGAESVFLNWLDSVLSVADGVLAISRTVADEFTQWLNLRTPQRNRPLNVGFFHLGADIAASIPTSGITDNSDQLLNLMSIRPTFMLVGTFEPRKGHAQTLAAFELLWAGGFDLNLIFVGKQGWMVDELTERLNCHPELNKRLFWLQGISDEYLEILYDKSACLIVASEGEGFGLPLIEAAQHCLPILARDIPVFREVAGMHAFYFDGMTPVNLADAVERWLSLYASAQHPKSDSMPWLTWKESAEQLMRVIHDGEWQYKVV